MGNVVYSAMISLDGFVARPDGALDWVLIDDELHSFVNEQQDAAGAYLYGRRMYELMASSWPPVDEDPDALPYMAAFARIWKAKPKVVFSQTLERVAWNARIARGDIPTEVAGLKKHFDKDLVLGGATLAGTFMRLDLIDDYHLFVNPVILGSGIPAIPALDDTLALRLVATRTFHSGVVFLHYRRSNRGASR